MNLPSVPAPRSGAQRAFPKGARLLAAILAVVTAGGAAAQSVAATPARATGAYQLAVQLPGTVHKGEPATLILRVSKGAYPVDDATACLDPAPLFVSQEDATDTTPVLGGDLGAAAGPASEPTCTAAIAAVRKAPGVYQFTWEPDTAGRVTLRFTVSGSRLDVPVDVASPPPNPVILMAFVLGVGAICGTAAWMRRARRTQGEAA